jgi:hypothetical protein
MSETERCSDDGYDDSAENEIGSCFQDGKLMGFIKKIIQSLYKEVI